MILNKTVLCAREACQTLDSHSYTVNWKQEANEGEIARRSGPWALQAELVHTYSEHEQLCTKKTPLGRAVLKNIDETWERYWFWLVSERALDELGLSEADRDAIAAELSARVTPLTEEELAENRGWLEDLAQSSDDDFAEFERRNRFRPSA